MRYLTNEDLIEKQRSFWDKDLAMEGDYVSPDLERISLEDIVLDDSLYTVQDDDFKERVDGLKSALRKGEKLPPLLLDSKNFLLDGYHRYHACKELNFKEVLIIRLIRGAN